MKLLNKIQQTTVPSDKELASKKWFLVDAKGKTLGHLCTALTDIIRGKNKAHFTPQLDCGDFVVVINAQEIRLAGNKKQTKMYYWHTQYPGGIRQRSAQQLLDTKPEQLIYDGVWGMLPRNKLRRAIIKKLRIFPGSEHEHTSQNPQPLELAL